MYSGLGADITHCRKCGGHLGVLSPNVVGANWMKPSRLLNIGRHTDVIPTYMPDLRCGKPRLPAKEVGPAMGPSRFESCIRRLMCAAQVLERSQEVPVMYCETRMGYKQCYSAIG